MCLISLLSKGRRYASGLPALICGVAVLATVAVTGPVASAAAATPATTGSVTGTITAVGPYQFTLQVAGTGSGIVPELTAAANTIAAQNWPYVWGGGHAVAGVASIGEPGGSGYNGKRKGFDCSGSVAAVLVAGGLWPAGASVPSDSGVIAELLQEKLIAKGAASGPGTVTLYDWSGNHIFMNISGRFWGTSDGSSSANSQGGPGWLNGDPYDATNSDFKPYHFLAAKLAVSSLAGETIGFDYPTSGSSVLGTYAVGSTVTVTYTQGTGTAIVATAVGQGTVAATKATTKSTTATKSTTKSTTKKSTTKATTKKKTTRKKPTKGKSTSSGGAGLATKSGGSNGGGAGL